MEGPIDVASYGEMKDARPNRIAEARRAKGWTQAQLAEAVDVHWVTISRLERGKIQLNQEWLEILGKVFGVDKLSLVEDKNSSKTIYVVGDIANNSFVNYYEEQDEIDMKSYNMDDVLSRWLRVGDDSLWPHYQEGDLIRFITVDEDEIFGYVGRICIVDGKNIEKSLFGFIEGGSTKMHCTIRPLSGGAPKTVEAEQIRAAVEVRYRMPWDASVT